MVLSFLEFLEECRDLSLQEWNFKDILADKLISLLKQQRIYWKQRGTIKWVKFGDEGTKFFHANATLKHIINKISVLADTNGVLQSDHGIKANILWDAYKDRLGVVEFQNMVFDLQSLFNDQIDLSDLEEPFSHEEIDQVVAHLPLDKSPGLDGFNTDFIKRCWSIIKEDFYDLCDACLRGKITPRVIPL